MRWHVARGFALAALVMGASSAAYAVGKPSSPKVSAGELELEYEAVGLIDSDPTKRENSHELEISYGVNRWFRPEIDMEYANPGDGDAIVEAVGAGAQFVLTQPGTHWVDSAVRVIYEHKPHGADEAKALLLLETQTGKLMHRANVVAAQELGSDAQSGGPSWQLILDSRYPLTHAISAGLELDSEFGQSRDFDESDQQKHYLGPVAYADLAEDVELQAGYLVGLNDNASNGAVRFALEYGIEF